MFQYKQILDILGRCMLDGNGMASLEVEVLSEGGAIGKAEVSLGEMKEQAEEITESMVLYVNTTVADMLIGENVLSQHHIDQLLERMMGQKKEYGIRHLAIQAVSCAVARTAAEILGLPLYQYLGGIQIHTCPTVRILLPSGKEPEASCMKKINRWKINCEKTEICRESTQEMERTQEEIVLPVSQYATVTGVLKELRRQKKESSQNIVVKDCGHTMDTFLVDLAVAAGADILELFPPVRGEYTVKYNRFKRILEQL